MERPLRVLHLINDLDEDGGAQRIVRDLLALQSGCRSSVITLHPVSGRTQAELGRLGTPHVSLVPLRFGTLRAARRLLQTADILHVHLFPSLYLAAFQPRAKLFTEHATWNRRRDRPWLRVIERSVYRRYDLVVGISDAAASALRDWLGPGAPEICVVGNGVRLERFSRVPRAEPRVPATISMIGSFTPQKDQATLIRAMGKLGSTGTRLRLIGDGPGRPGAESLARELGLGERVEFVGRLPGETIPGVLGETDVYVQSSRWEGFGLAVVEAMASGVPVLGTDVPGLRDVLGDRSALFPAGDADALAAKADELLTTPGLYGMRSRGGVERAGLFAADRMVDAYRDAYQRLAPVRGGWTDGDPT